MYTLLIITIVSALVSFPVIQAWDAPAHEVVATIAQIHLSKPVLSLVCDILYPSESNSTIGTKISRTTETHDPPCYLASIATWADQVRTRPEYRYTAPMHYIHALDDTPPRSCAFPGKQGWQGPPTANVLAALANVTSVLRSFARGERSPDAAEEALKFLVHFMGEMHQPLHISGRERGNGARVTWGGESTNLHWVWDGLLTERAINATSHNYSRPLSGTEADSVEPHLRGKAYDPLVRRIMHEGLSVGGRFDPEKDGWSGCPKSRKGPSHLRVATIPGGEVLPGSTRRLVNPNEVDGNQAILDTDVHVALDSPGATPPGAEKGWDDDVLCPYAWARQVHSQNCGLNSPVWPQGLDGLPELDTPEYAGRIAREWVVERLLATAGMRLANVLTSVLSDVATEDV